MKFPSLQQHGVKTARRIDLELREIVPRRQNDAGLLGTGDAFRRATEIRSRPCAHFDEYQRRPFAHDQIDFATSATKIARYQGQPLTLKIIRRGLFGQRPGIHAAFVHAYSPFGYTACPKYPAISRICAANSMFDATQPARPGVLHIVATPIGNLRDLSQRALDVLKSADIIAAEDTRTTQGLLNAHQIQAGKLTPLHDHNEQAAAARLLEALREGKSVAYVSDAGTPGISDPGARLVSSVRAAGIEITPIPGPSAVAAALSVAGIEGHWLFFGFLPAKPAARRKTLQELATRPDALVFYEAPHRIEETVEDLLAILGGARTVLFARELTKKFEQLHVCPLAEAPAWLASDENHRRGEFVLVVSAPDIQTDDNEAEALRVLKILLDELPLKQAAHLAARITGARKNALYDLALALKQEK